MRIGKLRHKCTIESYSASLNTFGEEAKTWATFCTAWCDIKPLNGNEKYVGAEKYATATHQVIMRFYAGIAPKMRLKYGERVFDIQAVLNVNEASKMMQLIVEEAV